VEQAMQKKHPQSKIKKAKEPKGVNTDANLFD